MIGLKAKIYNGKRYSILFVKQKMLGHNLVNFVLQKLWVVE